MRRILIILLLTLAAALPAQAERSQRFGEYEVHYNAFHSAFLQPDIARAAGLQRSKVQGVLLVSVLREGEPVEALVQVQASNLQGQLKGITLRPLREPGALYYVGNFAISQAEEIRFKLEVLPHGGRQSLPIAFRQQFFVD